MSQDPLSAWYADFFTELPNAVWRAAVPPEMTTAEVDFIIRTSGLAPGAGVGRALRQGDMRTLPTDIRVDVAVCMGNAFGYRDHAGTRKFLADLAGLLTPAGTLILDYGFVAEALLPDLKLEEPPMTIGGIEAVSVNDYDTANSRWITAFTFRRGGEEHQGTSVQHVYTAAEVTRLVTEAGFGRISLYGDTDTTPFRLGSPRLLLVAQLTDGAKQS